MAMKLYQSGELYNPDKPDSWLEAPFAALVTKHKEHLFPEFFAIKCPHPLPSRTGGESRPHFILIDRLYGAWYLVMLAVTQQSVTAVIRPRLEHMVQAVVLKEHIPALKELEPNLDETATLQLLQHEDHQTFLLTNELRSDWKAALHGLKVKLGILEVFRSRKQRARRSPRDEILRINGDQPEPPTQVVSDCTFVTPTLLVVAQPAILTPIPDRFVAFYKDQIVHLVKMPTAQGIVLQPEHGSGVPYSAHGYKLSRRGDLMLEIIDVPAPAQETAQ